MIERPVPGVRSCRVLNWVETLSDTGGAGYFAATKVTQETRSYGRPSVIKKVFAESSQTSIIEGDKSAARRWPRNLSVRTGVDLDHQQCNEAAYASMHDEMTAAVGDLRGRFASRGIQKRNQPRLAAS